MNKPKPPTEQIEMLKHELDGNATNVKLALENAKYREALEMLLKRLEEPCETTIGKLRDIAHMRKTLVEALKDGGEG